VGAVTVGAFLGDIGVFVDERPLVFHVAARAEGLCGHPLEVMIVGRLVWIVAVGAGHLVFRHRMMGKLGELHLDLGVAAGTVLILLLATDFLLGPFVQLVAIEAADFILGVYAGVPAVEVGR
jgi:hypothetical protein